MKYNNYLFKNSFLSTKLIFLLLISCLTVHGALQEQQKMLPLPKFQAEGFKTKEAFFFKENLNLINDNFDCTAKEVCKELNSIIQANYEQKIRIAQKDTLELGSQLWETYSSDQCYQLVSFPEKFSAYFQSQKSQYAIKLKEFKQAKKFLFEIIRLIKHESYIENALLRMDELVSDFEKYTFENEEYIANQDETIALKITYIQKKMLHMILIMEFKNQLFEFLESYFKTKNKNRIVDNFLFPVFPNHISSKPQITSCLDEKEKKIWEDTLNINLYFSYLSPISITLNNGICLYNTVSQFIQDPIKAINRKVFTNPSIKTIIQDGEKKIKKFNNKLLFFANAEMEPFANQITLISNVLRAGNKPAVWKFSTFLIKMIPRFIINRISNQPSKIDDGTQEVDKNSKEVAEKIIFAVQEFKKTRKTKESLSKILKSLIKTSGSFVPAIDFLNNLQEKVFDNAVPTTLAEHILELKNFLEKYSNYIEEKIQNLNTLLSKFEIDQKTEQAALKIDTFYDWATIFEKINKNNKKKNRKNFYKQHLPLYSFLTFKKRPLFDCDDNHFESIRLDFDNENYQLISNHLNTIYTTINEINTDYLKKISGIVDLQKTNIDMSILPDGYEKTMLFLSALKDINTLSKYINKPDDTLDENNEETLLKNFPGTQNLKKKINDDNDSLEKLNNKKTKSERAYNEAKNWLEHTQDMQQDFNKSITSLDPSLSRKILTKIASYFIMVFSLFINKERLLPFFDYSPFDEIILKEELSKYENKNVNLEKSVKKGIEEYEQLDSKMQELKNIIDGKEKTYNALKDFRNDIKKSINEAWNLD